MATDWQRFFGYLHVHDPEFNEDNFPLGEDLGDVAREMMVKWKWWEIERCWAEFLKGGGKEASLLAVARYIEARPDFEHRHQLNCTGARWKDKNGVEKYPVFYRNGLGVPSVSLHPVSQMFSRVVEDVYMVQDLKVKVY